MMCIFVFEFSLLQYWPLKNIILDYVHLFIEHTANVWAQIKHEFNKNQICGNDVQICMCCIYSFVESVDLP